MSRRTPATDALGYKTIGWLLLVLTLAILPHLSRLPLWISLLILAVGLWRWQIARQGWRLPSAVVRFTLTLGALLGIYASFSTLTGRDASIALLLVMMGLKLMESRQQRELFVLLFLAYFVLITHFLYSQSLLMVAYTGASLWLIVAAHICLIHGTGLSPKQGLRLGGQLLAQGLPLMLLLFVLFPRLPDPLWGLPHDAYSAMTGLDDSMSPGTISHLSQSDAVAFRVRFDGAIPEPKQRYWRGPILWHTDGRRWSTQSHDDSITRQPAALQLSPEAPLNRYTVTLEPHNRNWLFALDLPTSIPENAALSPDFQLLANNPIRHRLRYSVDSVSHYKTVGFSNQERTLALQLPNDRNPRTLALGRKLRHSQTDDLATVQSALSMFRQQPFIYSLTPPRLTSAHTSDEFLFATQKGFCEHFASSFTLLMRAAGIPARVVTGYQGGELNPVGDYLIVRQRDAHAWSEVWLAERGWVRVDPTAAVAPQRVELGIQNITQGRGQAVVFDLPQNSLLHRVIRNMRLNLDALNNGWNQWVLGYNSQQQMTLFEHLGLEINSWLDQASLLLLSLSALFAAFALYMLVPKQPPSDPVKRTYERFCRKLTRHNLKHNANEGALDFAARIARRWPDLKNEAESICQHYNQLRYSPHYSERALQQLKKKVAAFNVKPKQHR